MEPIPLSESYSKKAEPTFRQVNDPKISFLILSLLTEESSIKHRSIATELRNLLVPEHRGSKCFECVHPEWFDEPVEFVDRTSCNFCAYAHYCSIGKDTREAVEIIPLDGTAEPRRGSLIQCFDFSGEADQHVPNDPFVGFSHNAGHSRRLFLIEMDKFEIFFPGDVVTGRNLQCAVGYDRLSQQSIWAIDQFFLEEYEKRKIQSQLKFEDVPFPDLKFLTQMDRDLLTHVLQSKGWLLEEDLGQNTEENLHRFFLGLTHLIKKSPHFSRIASKGNASLTPHVEHPYALGGTGFMIFALRWMELRPNDLIEFLKEQSEQQSFEFDFSRLTASKKFDREGATQYMPRMPAIALIPSRGTLDLSLELPAAKIIDVHQYDGSKTLLLLDSLGLDLTEEIKYGLE